MRGNFPSLFCFLIFQHPREWTDVIHCSLASLVLTNQLRVPSRRASLDFRFLPRAVRGRLCSEHDRPRVAVFLKEIAIMFASPSYSVPSAELHIAFLAL